jgi:glucokinase
MDRQHYSIGIDIGASQIKAVAVAVDGELLQSSRLATDDASDGWKVAVPSVLAEIEESLGAAGAIGISSPGLARGDHTSISWMRGRMSATQGYVWADALRRSHPVPVINDAQAALLGERWRGAARGHDDAVLITLGTGVGGAILSGGRLLQGRLGRAGHLGHISLDPAGPLDIVNTPGSLEDAIGEHTLARRSHGKFHSTLQLIDAVAAGDVAATEIWNKSLRALAAGIVSIINVIDPAVVVIGGGIAGAKEALFFPLAAEMDRIEWRPSGNAVPIVPAQLGQWSGAYGAAWFALNPEVNPVS